LVFFLNYFTLKNSQTFKICLDFDAICLMRTIPDFVTVNIIIKFLNQLEQKEKTEKLLINNYIFVFFSYKIISQKLLNTMYFRIFLHLSFCAHHFSL
jgi:hypothetical protein